VSVILPPHQVTLALPAVGAPESSDRKIKVCVGS
jgi:hypothetical protein